MMGFPVCVCFVCLKRVVNRSGVKKRCDQTDGNIKNSFSIFSKFLGLVNEYLKLEGVDNPLFLNRNDREKSRSGDDFGKQNFCEECEVLISSVCQLHSELVSVQVRLSWKLGELGVVVEGSKRKVSSKLWNVLIKSLAEQLSVDVQDVMELRDGLGSKCAQKGEQLLPKIVIDRVSVPKSVKTEEEVVEGCQQDNQDTEEPEVDDNYIKMEVESLDGDDEDYADNGCSFPVQTSENEDASFVPEQSSPDSIPTDVRRATRWNQQKKPKEEVSSADHDDYDDEDGNGGVGAKDDSEFEAQSGDSSESDSQIESDSDWSEAEVRKSPKKSTKPKPPAKTSRIPAKPKKYSEKCEHCEQIFHSENAFKIHLKNSERPSSLKKRNICKSLQCSFCWRSFGYTQSLQMHMKTLHGSHLNINFPFFCMETHCSIMFHTKIDLNEHLVQKHSENISNCSKCNLGFVNPNYLQLHELLHKEPITSRGHFSCSSCPSDFTTVEAFQNHFNQEHGLRLKFECPKCETDFSTHLDLTVHLRNFDCSQKDAPEAAGQSETEVTRTTSKSTKPSGSNKYTEKCEHCDQIFHSEKTFRIHLNNTERLKKGSIAKSFHCSFCWRSFSYSQSFQMHMKKQHGKNVDLNFPFFCMETECSQMFENVADMNAHLILKHSENIATCSKCNLGFANQDYLQLHEQLHKEPETSPLLLRGRFLCSFCPSDFATVESFQDHYNQKHGLQLKFGCSKCDIDWRSHLDLTIHLRNSDCGSKTFPKPETISNPEEMEVEAADLMEKCDQTSTRKRRKATNEDKSICPYCGNVFGIDSFKRHRPEIYIAIGWPIQDCLLLVMNLTHNESKGLRPPKA